MRRKYLVSPVLASARFRRTRLGPRRGWLRPSPRSGPPRGSLRCRRPRPRPATAGPRPAGRRARDGDPARPRRGTPRGRPGPSRMRAGPRRRLRRRSGPARSAGRDRAPSAAAERDGQAVSRPVRIVLGPEELDQLVPWNRPAAAGDEDLEQVAGLLRFPLLGRDRDTVAQDAKRSQRQHFELGTAFRAGRHEDAGGASCCVPEPEPV
jgi:hypothetical protein